MNHAALTNCIRENITVGLGCFKYYVLRVLRKVNPIEKLEWIFKTLHTMSINYILVDF